MRPTCTRLFDSVACARAVMQNMRRPGGQEELIDSALKGIGGGGGGGAEWLPTPGMAASAIVRTRLTLARAAHCPCACSS